MMSDILDKIRAVKGKLGNKLKERGGFETEFGLPPSEALSRVKEEGKFTKEEANYENPTGSQQKKCGTCEFFIIPEPEEEGRCRLVEGKIDENAISDLWTPENYNQIT